MLVTFDAPTIGSSAVGEPAVAQAQRADKVKQKSGRIIERVVASLSVMVSYRLGFLARSPCRRSVTSRSFRRRSADVAMTASDSSISP